MSTKSAGHDAGTGDLRAQAPANTHDLYQAVWRWHFYAGLLVLPFLITLAVTGAAYLFRDEIDAIVHADVKQVAAGPATSRIAPSKILSAALAAHPGVAVKYTAPATATASAVVTIDTAAGPRLAVYVDPYRGTVLGTLPDRGTVMWVVRHLHSLKYFGPTARMIIEIVGGWSILLVATGVYLWWPRRQTGGVVSVRGTPARRVFWRDLHAVTGLFVGGFIVFLAVTGMPWSGVWGAKVNEWANGTNFGYPSGVYVGVPMSGEKLNATSPTAWSLEQAQVPLSAHPGRGAPIGIDRAVSIVEARGIAPGYALKLPSGPRGVYSATVYPNDLSRQRVLHLDQYSGAPLIEMRYADYGPAAKAIEWGINTHMGQQFGTANQVVLLIACLAMVVLAVSAAVMWWKRRPARSLGVPPTPQDRRVLRGLFVALGLGGLLFPLTGASLVAMIALDWLFARRRPA